MTARPALRDTVSNGGQDKQKVQGGRENAGNAGCKVVFNSRLRNNWKLITSYPADADCEIGTVAQFMVSGLHLDFHPFKISKCLVQLNMLLHKLCIALLWNTALAVFSDEAYQIDFHYPLLGAPRADTSFFHRPNPASKASLLYTLSEKSVLGAVNPKDGQLVWRQILDQNGDQPGLLRTSEGLDVVLSATGSNLDAWSAADGRSAWQRKFHGENVQDIAVSTQSDAKHVFVITVGSMVAVRKLDVKTGHEIWGFDDASGDEPQRLALSKERVFVISTHKTLLKGFKIKVTALDIQSGNKLADYTLSSESDVSSATDILTVAADAVVPFLAWTDSKRKALKVNVLGSKDTQVLDFKTAGGEVEKLEIHSTSEGKHFVVFLQTSAANWGEIYRIDSKSLSVKKIRDLPFVDGAGSTSATTVNGEDYFTRVTEKEILLETPGGQAGSWPIKSLVIPGLIDSPSVVHSTSEVVVKPGASYAIRSAVLLSTGDWALIQNGETGWSRPEALASVVRASWADLSDWSDDIQTEESSNLVVAIKMRLQRHVQQIGRIHEFIPNSIDATLSRFLEQSATAVPDRAFGFNKLLVLATENGRLVALDVGQKGRIVWNIQGMRSNDEGRSCSAELPWSPASVTSIKDLLLCLGELPGIESSSPSWLASTPLANPRLSFDTETGIREENKALSDIKYVFENGKLYGTKDNSGSKAWTFSPYADFKIHTVTAPSLIDEPVASIGKVLGDRKVLYKYLNPNAIAVISVNEKRKVAAVHLVDAVSGNVLYTSDHVNVDTSRPIASAISENWLSFSYTMDSPDDAVSKGYQLVMTEFYESDVPNDRGSYGTMNNFSTIDGNAPATKPYAHTLSFHVPEEISLMAVTQTGQGITSRQLLVGLPYTNSIVGIPSQVIDPRRLVGKDPTNEQMMEGLSRYSPMVDFDPKWYLNHRQEIAGLRGIMTTPALLESTSLVFAYGIDLFGTRVTPSFAFDILGNSFNKIQLLLTVAALFVGVFVVAPLIQRKQTNALWQAS